MKNIMPTEAEEQAALFHWAGLMQGKHPELKLLHHIPNGGYRNKREAASLQREGVKAGVPDICLPVARNGCHGLYIELKRRKGGRLSPSQTCWMEQLQKQGYQVAVCYGWEEAKNIILPYLEGRSKEF